MVVVTSQKAHSVNTLSIACADFLGNNTARIDLARAADLSGRDGAQAASDLASALGRLKVNGLPSCTSSASKDVSRTVDDLCAWDRSVVSLEKLKADAESLERESKAAKSKLLGAVRDAEKAAKKASASLRDNRAALSSLLGSLSKTASVIGSAK